MKLLDLLRFQIGKKAEPKPIRVEGSPDDELSNADWMHPKGENDESVESKPGRSDRQDDDTGTKD
jgi:hypothetical protein